MVWTWGTGEEGEGVGPHFGLSPTYRHCCRVFASCSRGEIKLNLRGNILTTNARSYARVQGVADGWESHVVLRFTSFLLWSQQRLTFSLASSASNVVLVKSGRLSAMTQDLKEGRGRALFCSVLLEGCGSRRGRPGVSARSPSPL